MKRKKLLFGLFALVILAVPLFIIFQAEDIIANGHHHKLHLRGYDPFDPFRGKYIRLNYDGVENCDENIEAGEYAYVTFETDSLGYSRFAYTSKTEPNHSDYYKGKLEDRWNSCAVDLNNIEKYFINEDKAFDAERIVQDYTRNDPNNIYVEIAVLNGEMRMVDIFVEGIPLLDFLEKE